MLAGFNRFNRRDVIKVLPTNENDSTSKTIRSIVHFHRLYKLVCSSITTKDLTQ
jgi:hypothetical protein